MSDAIRGLWVALPTPLSPGGAVDHAALIAHTQGLLRSGCDGVVPFGTTGEGQSFSAAERLDAAVALMAAGVRADQIGLGASFTAEPDTVSLVRSALAVGLSHMLLLPPYYYRDVTAQGIEDSFASVIDGIGDARLRVTLYHIPQVCGVPVPAPVAAALKARYGAVVAGLKDSSGDFTHFRAFRAAAPDLAVVVGNEADIGRALAEGGAGTICGMANIALPLVTRMFNDPAAPEAMQAAIRLIDGPFVPTLKAVLAAQTGAAGWRRVRAPLREAGAAKGEQIAAALTDLSARKAA